MNLSRDESNNNANWTSKADFETLCHVIGSAFAGTETAVPEPISSWVVRDIAPKIGHPERPSAYKFLIGFFIEDFLRHGGSHFGYSDGSGSLKSAVVYKEFDPSIEFKPISFWGSLINSLMGLWLLMKAKFTNKLPGCFSMPGVMQRFDKRGELVMSRLSETHQKYGPKGKHLYIFLVGTDPKYQGTGIGSKQMKHIADLADTSGKGCYLECSGEKNLAFYQKHGYKVVSQMQLKEDHDPTEVTVYSMVREPLAK